MRSVRIATVSFEVRDQLHTVDGNLAAALAHVADAAARGADVVCLPEAVLTTNVSAEDARTAERWRGAHTRAFAAAARTHGIDVVAPYYVRQGGRVFSQATVFRRDGAVAGFYRKVQLNGAETGWLAAGDKLPVISLSWGRVGLLLCFDMYYPEIARLLAMRGADVLFWPTITHGPTQEALRTQATARAIDNSLVVVEANLAVAPPYAPYRGRVHPGTARIIDHNGDVLAQTGRRPGIALADVDLDAPRLTLDCALVREPDHLREDVARMFRADLYAREYAALARRRGGRP